MANFNTHFLGAASAAGVFSSILLVTDMFTPLEGMVLWGAGTIGGFLPDLDSDSSPVLSGIFTVLGIFLSFICLFSLPHLPLIQLWGCMLLAFVTIRYGAMWCFAKLTKHRGSFHSLLAAATFGMGTTYLSWYFLGQRLDFAWAIGSMICTGYLVHLTLDECFSVNLENMDFKKSFGTALKPLSLNYWKASSLFLVAAGYFAWATPLPTGLDGAVQRVLSQPLYFASNPNSQKSTNL